MEFVREHNKRLAREQQAREDAEWQAELEAEEAGLIEPPVGHRNQNGTNDERVGGHPCYATVSGRPETLPSQFKSGILPDVR